jgi:hypothetical protein
MLRRWMAWLSLLVSMTGCTTPYHPPVFVSGTPDFKGLVDMLDASTPLDVVLVHGMCTHDRKWATDTMAALVRYIRTEVRIEAPAQAMSVGPPPAIDVIPGNGEVAGSELRFTGLVWSPLTAALKQQLAYDLTGTPTDCAVGDECKPRRASINGEVKDWLLNDCLADAMVYQGENRRVIRARMVQALTNVLGGMESEGPLVVISDSLGSKLVFDALSDMLEGKAPDAAVTAATARKASTRLAQVFMNANQLPILALADQDISQVWRAPSSAGSDATEAVADPVRRYLRLRRQARLSELVIVAFTDPNDLLSYRLMPSQFAGEHARIGDVLVSNDKTWFGLIEHPKKAHLGYGTNPDVARIVTCGRERDAKNPKCR